MENLEKLYSWAKEHHEKITKDSKDTVSYIFREDNPGNAFLLLMVSEKDQIEQVLRIIKESD